jgi:hypothetical protein
MAQQNHTTSGAGKPPDAGGKEVKLSPSAKKKELGGDKLEVEENGVKFLAHRTTDGRIIRDS